MGEEEKRIVQRKRVKKEKVEIERKRLEEKEIVGAKEIRVEKRGSKRERKKGERYINREGEIGRERDWEKRKEVCSGCQR